MKLFNRKKGFVLPWESWMKNELRSFCEESILNLDHYPAFNLSKVNSLWKNFKMGTQMQTGFKYGLAVLGKGLVLIFQLKTIEKDFNFIDWFTPAKLVVLFHLLRIWLTS